MLREPAGGAVIAAPELIAGPAAAPVVLTAEHASEALPGRWRWPDADQWLVGTHWTHDLGIAEITRALAAAVGAPAVLATFSRMLVDPNRPLGHVDLFRTHAEGREVRLNASLSDEEREERIHGLYEPYHRAVGEVVGGTLRAFVLSMHSFTPVYEGRARPMELGVLFDREDARAAVMIDALAAEGWRVAANEPYSGKEGLIYAANRHALERERPALEIEIRQDLATDPRRHPGLIHAIRRAIERVAAS